jgi:hypothetical protein
MSDASDSAVSLLLTEIESTGRAEVTRHSFPKPAGPPFFGVYLVDLSGSGASIEVWEGAGGFVLDVEDALHAEFPPGDGEDVAAAMWAVIRGGCSIQSLGLKFNFVAGSQAPIALQGRDCTVRRVWAAWPGFEEDVAPIIYRIPRL